MQHKNSNWWQIKSIPTYSTYLYRDNHVHEEDGISSTSKEQEKHNLEKSIVYKLEYGYWRCTHDWYKLYIRMWFFVFVFWTEYPFA